MKWKPPEPPEMAEGDYLESRIGPQMLSVSQFDRNGRYLYRLDELLHFDEEPNSILDFMGYTPEGPWVEADGIRSVRVQRKAAE